MKKCLFTTFCLLIFVAHAQEKVVIERNCRTNILFDENDPLSLISILDLNAFFLDSYHLRGIDESDYLQLTSEEKTGLLKFIGRDFMRIVLDENGEEVIEEWEDGMLAYVYEERDSLFIDLNGLSRMEFTLRAGNESSYERIEELHLWKRYANGTFRVLSIDARSFMSFHDANFILPVDKKWTKTILGNGKAPSFWSVLRDSSLQQLARCQRDSENGVYTGFDRNSFQEIFPYPYSLGLLAEPEISYTRIIGEEENYFSAYFDYHNLPFSLNLIDSITNYTIDNTEYFKHFDNVHKIMIQDRIPLYDADPDSPNFGSDVLHENDDGTFGYVYPEPEEEYFFVDYQPTIFVVKHIECDSLNSCKAVPDLLIFCISDGFKTPEIVSIFNIQSNGMGEGNSFFKDIAPEFPDDSIWDLKQFKRLKKIINKY